MSAPKEGSFPRRLLLGMVLLGIFVLCDIALFGWLIFRSLSERELNQILLEARTEAEELADQIAGDVERRGQDLWTAIATEAETQTYIDSVLAQRKIVEKVEIFDREGHLVFHNVREETAGDLPELDSALAVSPRIETRHLVEERPFERVVVPVGEYGTFVIGISRSELEQRLQVLRAELIRQAGWIAALTAALFFAAYFLIWGLLRRTQRLTEKAKEAERLAYVGTLASGLAHEIRSPLNSLNLNMQMLEEELDDTGGLTAGRRLMAITRSEITRLEGLVNDFLSYARPRRLDLEVVAATSLVEHLVEVLRGQVEAGGVRLAVDDRSGGATVEVDRGQLSQLLLNLTHNALEATRESGRPPRVTLELSVSGQRLVVGVRDNGVGLTADERARIFEVFYSTRKGGTGLGLAIVERIAKAHDAEIEVTSEKGQGTLVEVRLPLARATPGRAQQPVSSEAPPAPAVNGLVARGGAKATGS